MIVLRYAKSKEDWKWCLAQTLLLYVCVCLLWKSVVRFLNPIFLIFIAEKRTWFKLKWEKKELQNTLPEPGILLTQESYLVAKSEL